MCEEKKTAPVAEQSNLNSLTDFLFSLVKRIDVLEELVTSAHWTKVVKATK